MTALVESVALWLADFHLLAGALLAIVLAGLAALRQPARRMAAMKATLAALAVLAVLCALPGWSLVHLLSAEELPTPPPVVAVGAPAPMPAPMMAELATSPPLAPTAPLSQELMVKPTTAPTSPPVPISWPAVLVTIHVVGSALVVVWLTVGAGLARRMRRASTPAPQDVDGALRSIVGAAQPPKLLVNAAISTPLALGLARPAILLPAALVKIPRAAKPKSRDDSSTETTARDLAAILAHEWAHIVAGDLHTLAASRLLLVILWPQPLYWVLRRALRLDQETLADAAAGEVVGRIGYAEQLVGWARTAPARAPRLAGAVGLWEGPSQLKRRVAVLLDEKLTVLRHCSRRWRVGTACTALAAAALLSLVTLQRQEAAAQLVTGATTEAAEDAAAGTQSQEPADGALAADNATNHAAAQSADPFSTLAMMGYRTRRDAEPNVFSGRCLDENDQPLAGAKVTLVRGQHWSLQKEKLGETVADAEGKFRFESVIDVAAAYPGGAIPATHTSSEPMVVCVAQLKGRASREAAISQFGIPRDGHAVDFVMPPAATLRGRITDRAGNPIAGAVVARSNPVPMASLEGVWSARTDADGRYVIDDLLPSAAAAERRQDAAQASGVVTFVERDAPAQAGAAAAPGRGDGFVFSVALPTAFTVSHPDYGFQRLHPTALPGTADAQLEPGGRITGRAVLPDGEPAAGVTVRVYSSVPPQPNEFGIPMFNHGAVNIDEMHWTTVRADDGGRFEFSGLRAGRFDVWVETPGWFNRGEGEVAVEAGKTTTTANLKLTRGGAVRVAFVDEAGKPIKPESRLEARIGLFYDDKLSRQEDEPPLGIVGDDGAATVQGRPGRARVIVRVPLTEGGAPRWTPQHGMDILKAPIVEIAEDRTANAAIVVTPVAQVNDAAAAGATESAQGEETSHSVPEVGTYTAVMVADGAGATFPVDPNAPQQSPPAAPNAITIRCLDAAGAPLADVEVTLYRANFRTGAANEARNGRTNAAGEAAFTDLIPADALEQYKKMPDAGDFDDARYREGFIIVARGDGLATTSVIAQDFMLAQRGYSAELKIGPAQTLSGRVTDANGRPVAGAVVKAGNLASRFTIEGLNAVRTDADGRFNFTDRPKHSAADANKRLNILTLSTAAIDEVAAQAPRYVPGEDWEASKLIVVHPDYAVTSVDGGDIPGAVDATMLLAAAIAGRVVMDKTGDPVADMTVKAFKRPELELGPDGVIRQRSTAAGRLLTIAAGHSADMISTSHSAETRTDAAGRYRMTNLPAGVYDVWASPPRAKNPLEVQLFNHGVAGLAVAAGPQPVAAPELVVGEGVVVEGQLVDGTTGQPIGVPEGSRAMVDCTPVGGPRSQDRNPTRLPLTARGTFETRVAPGKFRIIAFVFDGPDPKGKLVFQSPDNAHSVGEVFDGNHGGRVSANVKVFPVAVINAQREARRRAYNLLPDDSKGAEAVAAFSEALQETPNDHDLLAGRARANEGLRNYAAAVADYEQMLKTDPTSTYAAMGLANLLATCPDANIRDGARAVPLAEMVVAAVRQEDSFEALPRMLALLAAAQAEAGQFDAAVATQREVIKLAPQDQQDDMNARLRLYENREPFHRE